MASGKLNKVNEYLWEMAPTGGMRVPARIYATERMLPAIQSDKAPEQAANVAHLPGILVASLAMPDIHWGYGFPIGGVAAFDTDEGVISPGGVGYDINCGVRLMGSRLHRDDVEPRLGELVERLYDLVPTGVGQRGPVHASPADLQRVAQQGARWAITEGFGGEEDLEHIEENGHTEDAETEHVSERAWKRGKDQLGTLGSGNHFLEVDYVAEIYDEEAAGVMGLFPGQVTVTIHCGSRGFGYQVCDEAIRTMIQARKVAKLVPLVVVKG